MTTTGPCTSKTDLRESQACFEVIALMTYDIMAEDTRVWMFTSALLSTVNGNRVVTIISLKGRTGGNARYNVNKSCLGKNVLDLDAPGGIIIRRFEMFYPIGGSWSVGHNSSE